MLMGTIIVVAVIVNPLQLKSGGTEQVAPPNPSPQQTQQAVQVVIPPAADALFGASTVAPIKPASGSASAASRPTKE
jgi:hypothetical protein